MTFTASDVLLKAASRIEEEGMWCQYKLFEIPDDMGICEEELTVETLYCRQLRVPECLMGAVASSVMELLGHWDLDFHHDALGLFTKHTGAYPELFNDTPDRTAHEVAEAMRQAAS